MSSGQQVPSVGRIVHYVYGDRHCAAIITDAEPNLDIGGEPAICLTVFLPNEESFTSVAAYDATCQGGTWHWPEFVPPK